MKAPCGNPAQTRPGAGARRSLLLLVVLTGLAAGARAATAPYWLLGRRPVHAVRRVVSLAPNLTEMMFALGAGSLVVGVTRYDDYPPAVKKLPRVGGFIDPSVEGILALQPDLVICTPNPGGRQRLEVLVRMRVAVLVLPCYDLAGILAALERLGQVVGRRGRAARLRATMKARITEIGTSLAGRARPRVLLLYGHRPLVAAGPGSFAHEMVELAGGRNVLEDSPTRYPVLPLEQVIRLAPDIIIDAAMAGGGEAGRREETSFWKRFSVIPAVRRGRVYRFDSALWFRPGPRVVEGIERLARLLHPEVALPGAAGDAGPAGASP